VRGNRHIRDEAYRQAFLPTRVLDVEVDSDPDEVRLCLGQSIRRDRRYVTISYCRGAAPALRTTRDTIERHSRGIKIAKLPPTFRDAVIMTRELGVRYLWIDALCIIQDSTEDRLSESAAIDQIYGKSYCTLAASSSKSGDGGLFNERDPRRSAICTLAYPSETGVSAGIVANLPRLIAQCFENEPLRSHGWALQERLLSPRTIHFTSSQAIWECREAYVAEEYPEFGGGDVHLWNGNDNTLSFMFKTWDNRSDESNRYENLISVWYDDIVRQYTTTLLPLPADCLPALSGLARMVQKLSGSKYFAGLWDRDLLVGLGWRVVSSSARFPHDPAYRAPSWSWAAVDTPVEWFFSRRGKKDKDYSIPIVKDIQVHALGQDEEGQVSGGYLLISTFGRRIYNRVLHSSELEGNATYVLGGRETRICQIYANNSVSENKNIGEMFLDRMDSLSDDQLVVVAKILGGPNWLIEGEEWPQQALALVELKEDEIHRLRGQQRAIEGGERINRWDSEGTKVFRRIGFVRIFGGFQDWLNNATREDFLII
jgi:hypothetical protein